MNLAHESLKPVSGDDRESSSFCHVLHNKGSTFASIWNPCDLTGQLAQPTGLRPRLQRGSVSTNRRFLGNDTQSVRI